MRDVDFKNIIIGVTIIYLITVLLYNGLFIYINFGHIELLSSNELGDFLAGIFAPLAFLFLYVGYRQNTISLNLQAKELQASTKALEEQVIKMQEALDLQNSDQESKHFYVKPFLNYKYLNFIESLNDGFYYSEDGEPVEFDDPHFETNILIEILNEGGDAFQFEMIHPETKEILFNQYKISSNQKANMRFSLTKEEAERFNSYECVSNQYDIKFNNKYGRDFNYKLDFSLCKSRNTSHSEIFKVVPLLV